MHYRYSLLEKAFYPSDIEYKVLPSDLIDVSVDEFNKTLELSDNETFDVTSDGIVKVSLIVKAIKSIKSEGSARIDSAAERARLKYITTGSGQALVYDLKRNELLAYDKVISDGGSPIAINYPLMNERAARKGVTLDAVATEWRAKVTEWIAIAAQIEGLREGAKDAIDAVADTPTAESEIEFIVNGITWPSPA